MPTLSACLIARNEQELLSDCLRSIVGVVDEIVVADTGSSDDTKAIAARMGARVLDVVWDDDFARARNAALDAVRTPWVLVIDADERLDRGTTSRLGAAMATNALAMLVAVDSDDGRGRVERRLLPRLFQRHPAIRFDRPVHESIMNALAALGQLNLVDSGVRIIHIGYRHEVVKTRNKVARNLRILRRADREGGDLFNLYKLAQTLSGPDQAEEQQAAWLRALGRAEALDEDERRQLPFLPTIYFQAALGHRRHGDPRAATAALDLGIGRHPESPELHWLRADLAVDEGDVLRAANELSLAADAPGRPGLAGVDPAAIKQLIAGTAKRVLDLHRAS